MFSRRLSFLFDNYRRPGKVARNTPAVAEEVSESNGVECTLVSENGLEGYLRLAGS
jgi:hypothetical protein